VTSRSDVLECDYTHKVIERLRILRCRAADHQGYGYRYFGIGVVVLTRQGQKAEKV